MSDVANELLECGTSLAELEYAAASADEVLLSQPTAAVEHKTQKVVSSIEGLRDLIASDVLTDAAGGNFTTFDSPFPLDLTPGAAKLQSRKLPLVYCDQTASNRPVKSVEEYLAKVCLPLYGNTHTNTSITGSQSTAFVAEARQIVAEETNAKITGKASLDVVLFAGQGATSAVELLIDCLGITYTDKGAARPVVFVGPYEHHSCMIPFRESGCEVVTVPESTVTKQVDVAKLEELLQRKEYQGRLKMGTFTAASNVTGKVCNVDEISAALHRHGALAFFDYATAAPYVKIDMNPPPSTQYPVASLLAKDAVFLSPHKMLGGVGAPGVLIIKKHLVSQYNPPKRSGGGTVFYVTNTHHRFLSNRIERYEGGSPNVPGIIRVGLAFLLKRKAEQKYAAIRDDEVSSESDIMSLPSSIEQYDYNTHDRVALYLKQHAPNIVMLDRKQNESRNLPIFSFLIRFGNRFLHYNYVCAVLNDVFGIQSRGGCQCAGPYSQSLLGLTDMTADGAETPNQRNVDLEEALIKYKERAELLRPGFTRLSLPFKGLKTEEVDYVIKALEWTSKHGWALLCQYRCNHRTGEFRHASRQGRPLGQERKWLGHFDFAASALILSPSDIDYSSYLRKTLSDADDIFASVVSDQSSIAQAFKMVDTDSAMVASGDENLEHLRWYVTAKECASLLSRGITESPVASDIIGAIRPCSSYMPSVGETQVCEVAEMCNDDTLPTDVSDKDGSSFELTQLAEFNDRERKKANRDSSTWGQGISLHSSSKTQSEGLSVSEVLPVKQSNCRHRHVTPPAKLMRLVTNAVMQWEMIQEGDRLLLGLSGGKDSLTLLHCLLELKRKLRTKFEIEICTIDPMTPSFDPSPLIPYVESLGLKYHFIKDDIVARASTSGTGGSMVKSLCAFCARMKRGNLYACARKNNCNKLVLAQHLDDCAESFMMSVMHNGFLRTMKAHYQINAGDLSVIRPMVYCRESLMAEFAKMKALPVINENCPACFEEPKERARIKKLLSREETLYPNFYDNIRRSLLPLMHEDATSILRCYTEETLAKSRKDQKRERSPDTDDFRHVPKKRREDGGLGDIPDDDLVLELARRKAAKYHLAGAMKRNDNDATTDQSTEMGVDDPTSQLCSLKGGNGTIPCYELME